MRAVNLLPSDAYATKRWWDGLTGGTDLGPAKNVVFGFAAAVGLVAVLLGVAYVHERNLVHHRTATLASLNERVAAAEASVAAARAAQATAESRLTAFTSLASQRVVWERVLVDLAHVLPGNTSLQNLTAAAPAAGASAATTPSATPSAGPGAFNLAGSAGSQRGVALVLDRLALLPWLSGITLQTSAGANGSPVQFTIGASLSSTGGK